MDNAIVALIIVGAVACVARLLWRKIHTGGCACAGGCGCACGGPVQGAPTGKNAPGPCAGCGQAGRPESPGTERLTKRSA